MVKYPRDLHGYGANPVDPKWPGKAKIAVQFVINYEEGGENNILHGDTASEAFLSEIVGADAWPGQRHWNMESIYEYGARAGFWRLHRMFTSRKIPVTVFGVTTALQRSPAQVAAMQEAEWEIASHGLKWIEYKDFTKAEERKHMREAIKLHAQVTGAEPRGWYTGRCSINTVDLVSEEGIFDYVSDSYADDLPYWRDYQNRPQLVIPYALDTNDMRFATQQGFNSGDQFFTYLRDSFDMLYKEGLDGSPKLLNIGLHCRLAGRPGRASALERFLDYVNDHKHVWIARRIDIAVHWKKMHPFTPKNRPSAFSKRDYVNTFGGIFEHSAWIAERAFKGETGPANDTATGLHALLCGVFRSATDKERLGVLNAHPDLAGKLAQAKRLTGSSTREQESVGLESLSDNERTQFIDLNNRYMKKHGFPFIIAVRENTKTSILKAFKTRINNDRETEFATACKQVERIAYHRLTEILED